MGETRRNLREPFSIVLVAIVALASLVCAVAIAWTATLPRVGHNLGDALAGLYALALAGSAAFVALIAGAWHAFRYRTPITLALVIGSGIIAWSVTAVISVVRGAGGG